MFQTFYKFEEKLLFDGKNSKKSHLDGFSVVKVCVSYSTKIVFKIRWRVIKNEKGYQLVNIFSVIQKWWKTSLAIPFILPSFFRRDEKRGKNNRDIFQLINSLSYL